MMEIWKFGGKPLRDWAESLISEDALSDGQVFDVAAVRAIWRQHLAAKADVHVMLWRILMYQAWKENLKRATPKSRKRVTV